MKIAGEHSELLSQQAAAYEPRTQTVDASSNLDDFEVLLAAAERASKATASAAAAGAEGIRVPQQGFVQSQK
jgi:hypothetical protein